MALSKIIPITDPHAIPIAKKIIQEHGTIVFPTDTIYGIAADAFSPEGIQKIYTIKKRPVDKALPILIGDLKHLDTLLLYFSEIVQRIAQAFWPGALTLIVPKSPNVPPELSPYPTIGVRMPDLAFTLDLLKNTGPLATTSANLSDGPNPTTVQDVTEQLGAHPDLILDGGSTPGPIASTVIDVSSSTIRILREGPISMAEINTLLDKE